MSSSAGGLHISSHTGGKQGKIKAEEAKEARDRITVVPPVQGLSGLRDADMVIEVRFYNRFSPSTC